MKNQKNKKEEWEEEYWKKFVCSNGTNLLKGNAKEMLDFIRQQKAQELQKERERVIKEILRVRDLRVEEKGKPLEFWEGYTAAIVNTVKELQVKSTHQPSKDIE